MYETEQSPQEVIEPFPYQLSGSEFQDNTNSESGDIDNTDNEDLDSDNSEDFDNDEEQYYCSMYFRTGVRGQLYIIL